VAYYYYNGDVCIAPMNYELRPGDDTVAVGWSAVVLSDKPDDSLQLAGSLRRWDGPPPGADDPNYDAEPEWWLSG
jgi:hypothetical protein